MINAIYMLLLVLALPNAAWGGLKPKCEVRKIALGANEEKASDPLAPEVVLQALNERLHALNDKLEPYTNPFAAASSYEDAERIYQLLSVRPDTSGGFVKFEDVDGKETNDTPAQQVRELLNHNIGARDIKYDSRYLAMVLHDVDAVLKDGKATRRTQFSAALSIRLAHEYARRFVKRDPVDRDGKPIEKKQEEKKDEKKGQKPQPPQPPPPPKNPKLSESYKPHTKDTKQPESAGPQQKVAVAEFSGVAKLMKVHEFNDVVRGAEEPFMSSELPGTSTDIPPYEPTTDYITVHMNGDHEADVFRPSGYELLAPQDPNARLERLPTGKYVLHTDQPTVRIPVRRAMHEALSPEALDRLRRPVGITEKELPPTLLAFLRTLKGREPLAIAKAVEEYFQKNFLYSVGPRPETDVIDALKAGAFQCDLAAFSMVAIMRDVFKIPCRAISGMRTKPKREGGKLSSIVEAPGEGHAWVEVYHDGQWREYDPTPRDKDQKDDKKKSGDPEEQWQEEEQKKDQKDQKPKDDQKHDDKDQEDKPGQQGDEKDQKKKRKPGEPQAGKDKDKKPGEEGEEHDKDKAKDGGKEEKKAKEDPHGMDEEDVAKNLTIGSVSMASKRNTNPLIERIGRVMLRQALSPNNSRTRNIEALNRLIPFLRESNLGELETVAREAIANLQQIPGDSVSDALNHLRRKYNEQDLNVTHHQIHNMIRYLEAYSKTLDVGGAMHGPAQLLGTLRKMRDVLEKLNHPEARQIALVNNFMDSLPPISRQLIRDKYNLKDVGPNAATTKIATELMNGKLKDYLLIAELAPLTDFILDSSPEPQYRRVKTILEDQRYRSGNDLMPTNNPLDALRAMRMDPSKSVWENMHNGTLYAQKRKLTNEVPAATGNVDEQKRMTIVGYDTSGSMEGDPGDFQAGLLAAFVDKALSDVAPGTGNHRHTAMLMGFDMAVHTRHPVLNTQQAKDIIRSYRARLKNTGQGTKIQEFLEQSLAAIADAQKKAGEPLKKANIILMTDGQDSVDLDKLRKLRAAIDSRTKVQIMFISINGTNPELIQYSLESGNAGFNGGFYREFTGEDIGTAIKAAANPRLPSKREAFFTTKPATEAPPDLLPLLRQGADESDRYSQHIIATNRTQSPTAWYKKLETLKAPEVDRIDRPIESWLSGVRARMNTSVLFQDRPLTQHVLHDLCDNWHILTGARFDTMSSYEIEQLRHLLTENGGSNAP